MVIFDYLDGCDVYRAFLNLNQRFQELVKSWPFLVKIKFQHRMSKKQHMNKWKVFLILNKQQIFLIDVFLPLGLDRLCAEFPINSIFSRLEWFSLKRVHSNQIMWILIELSCLPYLLWLPINISDHLKDLTNISRLIVTFPLLKYYKLLTYYFYVSVQLSMAIDKQFITIEYMVNASFLYFRISYLIHVNFVNWIFSIDTKLIRAMKSYYL